MLCNQPLEKSITPIFKEHEQCEYQTSTPVISGSFTPIENMEIEVSKEAVNQEFHPKKLIGTPTSCIHYLYTP